MTTIFVFTHRDSLSHPADRKPSSFIFAQIVLKACPWMDSILFQLLNLKDMDQLDPSRSTIPILSDDDDTKVQLLRSDREIIYANDIAASGVGS